MDSWRASSYTPTPPLPSSGPRLATVKLVVAQIQAHLAELPSSARSEAAEASFWTLLKSMHATLFMVEEEPLKGWLQVAWQLTNLHTRLLVDMLAPPLGELQIRVATLLDIPDLPPIDGLAGIHEAIKAAIRIGAPRYNSGDHAGCCTIYWATIQTLLATVPAKGVAGYARTLGQLRPIAERDVLPIALAPADVDKLAWDMRYALDAVLEMSPGV
jgi:hypothetical protein